MTKVLVINANSVLFDMFRLKERLAPSEVRWVHTPDEIRGIAPGPDQPRIVDLGFLPRGAVAIDRTIAILEELERRGLKTEGLSL